MNGEGQDPQNRKDHMHILNEWLGQEHATGYRKGIMCAEKAETEIKRLQKLNECGHEQLSGYQHL